MFMIDFFVNNDVVHTILVSIFAGSIVGIEREYRNKSAGFRTVILICLGATIFTIASRLGKMSDDRIAANIVTGIGFLGAGVIYQGKFSVQGLTTAAVIWATAAIGMIIGFGEYKLGVGLALVMLIILSVFYRIEIWMSDLYSTRIIHVTFIDSDVRRVGEYQDFLKTCNVSVNRTGLDKDENKVGATFEIAGKREMIRKVNEQSIGLDYVYMYSNP